MNEVNKTLYIPLYGKAYVSHKGLFIEDKKAEEIWGKEGFALKGKSKSKWLAFYMGIRSAVFDQWLDSLLTTCENAVVLHIGCGLDSRVLRAGSEKHMWYDVDFPEVIQERKRYYSESSRYRMIAGDVRDNTWLKDIPERHHAVIVMEGVSMYLTTTELQAFTSNLCAHFEKVDLLMDCYTTLAAKLSKYRNPVNDVGVTEVCGLDDPTLLESAGLTYVQEHPMTPGAFINELRGAEKFIFKKLYTGTMSKKLYRLYAFKKG